MIKDYCKSVDVFTKDLLPSTWYSRTREELKVVQECADGKRGEYQEIFAEDKVKVTQYTARNNV